MVEFLLLMTGFVCGVIAGKLLCDFKDSNLNEYKKELARLYARKEFENAHKNST